MNVLILGGGGFLGQKLAQNLSQRGTLRSQAIHSMTLADLSAPPTPDAPFPVRATTCDITNPASVAHSITDSTHVIYLLAAIVSGQAEADFEAGLSINLHGVLNVLERCRTLGTNPVVIFSSSLAVYGGDIPNPVGDHSVLTPQTSYGAQKAMGEMLINDYTRKGFIDGRAFRLPTITVRPGKPNRAASSFMSSILREPLNGQEAVCPVDPGFQHYYLSPRRCVDNLIKGAEIPSDDLGTNRVLQMPGRTWSIQQMIDAMTAVAGPAPTELIRFEDQPEVSKIVSGWKHDIRADRAEGFGLTADESFEDNIRFYIEDDKPRSA